MLELGTVGAILAEVEERTLGFEALEGVVIVPPSLAAILDQTTAGLRKPS